MKLVALRLVIPWASRALTGAWIETSEMRQKREPVQSRALTGAWIETDLTLLRLGLRRGSRPHGRVD